MTTSSNSDIATLINEVSDNLNTSTSIISSSYVDLFGEAGLATTGQLVPGQQYSFDFQSTFLVPGTNGTVPGAGEVEKFIVTAISPTDIGLVVKSVQYPFDFIKYNPSNTLFMDNESTTGCITWRECTLRSVAADFDWRALIVRCYERVEGSGVYSSFYDTGFGYQDFPVFKDIRGNNFIEGQVPFATIKLLTHRNDSDGLWAWPFVCFQNGAYKVFLDWGNDYAIFCGEATNVHHGCCAQIAVEGYTRDYFSAPARSPGYVTGNLRGVSVLGDYVGQVNGSLRDCIINAGLSTAVDNTINGDHTGVIFGPTIEGPGWTSPNLIKDPGFNDPSAWAGGSINTSACILNNLEETVTEVTPFTVLSGRKYVIGCNVYPYTSGSLNIMLGGDTLAVSGVGLWQKVVTTINTNNFTLSNTDMVGNVNTIWCKLVED